MVVPKRASSDHRDTTRLEENTSQYHVIVTSRVEARCRAGTALQRFKRLSWYPSVRIEFMASCTTVLGRLLRTFLPVDTHIVKIPGSASTTTLIGVRNRRPWCDLYSANWRLFGKGTRASVAVFRASSSTMRTSERKSFSKVFGSPGYLGNYTMFHILFEVKMRSGPLTHYVVGHQYGICNASR